MIITLIEILIIIYLSFNLIFTFYILKNYMNIIKDFNFKNLSYLLLVCLIFGSFVFIYTITDKELNC